MIALAAAMISRGDLLNFTGFIGAKPAAASFFQNDLLLSVMVDGNVHDVSSLLAHFLHLLVEYFHSVEIYFCLSLLSMQHCPLSCFGQLFAHRSAHRSDEGRDV